METTVAITILMWTAVAGLFATVGPTRLWNGLSLTAQIAFNVATIPLDAVWGVRKRILWSALGIILISLGLIFLGIELEHSWFVALGGILLGLYLAFLTVFANGIAWYLSTLVKVTEGAGTLFREVLVGFFRLLKLTDKSATQIAQLTQDTIRLIDHDAFRGQVRKIFGFITVAWLTLVCVLTMAPYWEIFFSIPVLALFGLTIGFIALQNREPDSAYRKIQGVLATVMLLYFLGAVFGVLTSRSNDILARLPAVVRAPLRYVGAIRDQSSTHLERASLPHEVDAVMTLVEVTEDTSLYVVQMDNTGVAFYQPSQELKVGTHLASEDPKTKQFLAGHEPVIEVVLPDKRGEFVTSRKTGYVLARKVRILSPLTKTGDQLFSGAGLEKHLPSPGWLLVAFVLFVLLLWRAGWVAAFTTAFIVIAFGLYLATQQANARTTDGKVYTPPNPFIGQVGSRRVPSDMSPFLSDAAAMYTVPLDQLAAICLQESGCNPDVIDGGKGEIGPMQIWPPTGISVCGRTESALRDTRNNVMCGGQVYKGCAVAFGHKVDGLQKTILCYNNRKAADRFADVPWNEIPPSDLQGGDYDSYNYVLQTLARLQGMGGQVLASTPIQPQPSTSPKPEIAVNENSVSVKLHGYQVLNPFELSAGRWRVYQQGPLPWKEGWTGRDDAYEPGTMRCDNLDPDFIVWEKGCVADTVLEYDGVKAIVYTGSSFDLDKPTLVKFYTNVWKRELGKPNVDPRFTRTITLTKEE